MLRSTMTMMLPSRVTTTAGRPRRWRREWRRPRLGVEYLHERAEVVADGGHEPLNHELVVGRLDRRAHAAGSARRH
jgi:hypothetical protein